MRRAEEKPWSTPMWARPPRPTSAARAAPPRGQQTLMVDSLLGRFDMPVTRLHQFVSHPAKEKGVGLFEVLDRVTMHVFVGRDCSMIAAPVQYDVNGVPKGSHFARVAAVQRSGTAERVDGGWDRRQPEHVLISADECTCRGSPTVHTDGCLTSRFPLPIGAAQARTSPPEVSHNDRGPLDGSGHAPPITTNAAF